MAVFLSLCLHGAVLWLAVYGLPYAAPPADAVSAVQVRLISAEELAPPAPLPDPEPASPEPAAAPEPAPAPQTATPEPEAPAPEAPEPGPAPDVAVLPPAVERVAPVPQPEPPAAVPEGPRLVPPTAPTPERRPAEASPEPQAPEAAAPQTITEAVETAPDDRRALQTAPRPAARPARPQPAPAPPPDTAAEPATDPIADAIADALAGTTAQPGATRGALAGDLTGAERDALRLAVSPCWNFGGLSVEASRVTVTVYMAMHPDGRVVGDSLRMVGFDGGTEDAARQAFDTARRAIIVCQGTGYPLPRDKYDRWREIEMTFNPERMRLR